MGVRAIRGAASFARRAIGLILAGFLALSVAVAAITVAQLHDHDCSGDGCETCLVLEMSQAALAASAIPAARTLAAWMACLLVGALASFNLFGLVAETPVTQRVKLLI